MPKLAIVLGMVFLLSFTTLGAGDLEPVDQLNYSSLPNKIRRQVDCLTDNIYYEARNQSTNGMLAVGYVTMNRVESNIFPSTICGVVKQKTASVCQFSWWCDASVKARAMDRELYNQIRHLATWVYFNHDKKNDVTKGAMFYHAAYVSPGWKGLRKTVRIDTHIFYTKV